MTLKGHNPYFNRWFSAISLCGLLLLYGYLCHNPYFNRWFSAIIRNNLIQLWVTKVTILILIDGFLQSENDDYEVIVMFSHNPYFNRWFSAI